MEMDRESNSSVNTQETVETHNARMIANIEKEGPEQNDRRNRGISLKDMLSNLKKKRAAEKAAKEAMEQKNEK